MTPDTNAPTAPAGLVATGVSPSQINLSWTSSTDDIGVVGYRIERSQGAGSTNFFLLDLTIGTNYSDANLTTAMSCTPRIPPCCSQAPLTITGYGQWMRRAILAGNRVWRPRPHRQCRPAR